MKKGLVFFICVLGLSTASMAQQSDTTKSTVNNTFDRGVMFEAYLIVDAAFPTNAFSIANGDSYITTVKDWISSDENRYTSILSGASTYTHIKINWSDYDKMNAQGQAAMKEWIAARNSFFVMQLSLQDPARKVVLLSQADFTELQTLLSL